MLKKKKKKKKNTAVAMLTYVTITGELVQHQRNSMCVMHVRPHIINVIWVEPRCQSFLNTRNNQVQHSMLKGSVPSCSHRSAFSISTMYRCIHGEKMPIIYIAILRSIICKLHRNWCSRVHMRLN